MSVLVVAALREEVAKVELVLREDDVLVVTGPGKVNAAIGLTSACLEHLPDAVLNLGTCGSLKGGHDSVYRPSKVVQGDFDGLALELLTGQTWGEPMDVDGGEGTVLVTTDRFITARTEVEHFVRAGIDVCDMEAYAYAAVCEKLALPFYCIKVASDQADEDASHDFIKAMDLCATRLATAYEGFTE